jgi:hypothetical protein
MKKIIIAMAGISAIAAAAPAAAQFPGQYQGQYQGQVYGQVGDRGVDNEVLQLQARIEAGIRSGRISGQEAVRLRTQLDRIVQMERRYGRDGLQGRERAFLQQRINTLRQELRSAERNGRYGDRGDRYDRGDRDDRYDRDRSDGNRGGVLGGVLGGTLQVGQRVSGGLGGVPNDYRGQFRDGNGVYYRSDGRAVYQIDARTDVVLRVFPMGR